ncbi:MAG: putative iron-sulfur cluster-binding metallochaperone [Leptonema sp. (in: bacteria)]
MDCCNFSEISKFQKISCPSCNQQSSFKIKNNTLKHLLKLEKLQVIANTTYYFCSTSNCNIVYFSKERNSYFTKEDVQVKVFSKDEGEEIPICYCFGWSRKKIKEAIKNKINPMKEIEKNVRKGICHCEVKNPKGRCCLGDVYKFVQNM